MVPVAPARAKGGIFSGVLTSEWKTKLDRRVCLLSINDPSLRLLAQSW
jgi:hypothetical protein